ncbi:hypothetical protein [Kitasatospora brasiliensis]|uniref:hypothetical protein n=1 Tax=Kitasatospora brasiliensis TaxID=3058040 RepID=UPI00292F2B2C|nr:hypothetical protein [Kitasatospora sp. K002]
MSLPTGDPEVPEPTTAERVRSLLGTTSSLTVRALGEQHHLDTPVSVHGSRLRLRAALDDPLTAAAAQHGLPVHRH